MVSETIGLLSGFGWVVEGDFQVILFKMLLLTPIGFILIGIVGEGRLVPLRPSKQFLSFFPGDLFLGMFAAMIAWLARDVSTGERFYNSAIFHVLVLAATFSVAIALTVMEYTDGAYPLRAILSPTKLYHNLLLYGGYSYVVVTTTIAVLAGSEWSALLAGKLAVSFVVLGVWVILVIEDNSLSSISAKKKAQSAHVDDWKLFGVMSPGVHSQPAHP